MDQGFFGGLKAPLVRCPRVPGRYRRTPTPGGLEQMEKGTLAPFDLETYANLDTGVLEEYLDERGRGPAFTASAWSWRLVLAASAIGAAFAAVNVYVGMKTGVIVAGAWYVAFLLATSGRNRAPATSVATGAALAASAVATGAALFLPALVLLASPVPGVATPLAAGDLPGWALASVVVLAGGFLALAAVAFLRRRLVVEDPLPYPGSEPFVRLLEMADAAGSSASRRAGHGLRLGLAGSGIGATWAVLRDAPLLRGDEDRATVIGSLLGRFGAGGTVGQPLDSAKWTWLGLALSPLLASVGWFLRLRGALILLLGAAFAWLVAVPLAVALDVPTSAAGFEGVLKLSRWAALGEPSAVLAHAGPVRWLAAGALVGAGIALLARHPRAIAHGARILARAPREARRSAVVPGRGLWEPRPLAMVALALAAVAALGAVGALVAGAGGWVAAALGLLVLLPFLVLGLVVLGESGSESVSGAGALVLLLAYAAAIAAGVPAAGAIVLALLAGAAYATASAAAGALLLGQKLGLYAGARPVVGLRSAAPAIAAAGIVAAATALALAGTLAAPGEAIGAGDLAAPHASAMSALARLVSGETGSFALFLVGLLLGIGAELLLGGGGAFAVGMFLPFGFAAAIALGGGARWWWESRLLPARVARHSWDAEKRSVALLDTYLAATGLIVGEAAIGILLVFLL